MATKATSKSEAQSMAEGTTVQFKAQFVATEATSQPAAHRPRSSLSPATDETHTSQQQLIMAKRSDADNKHMSQIDNKHMPQKDNKHKPQTSTSIDGQGSKSIMVGPNNMHASAINSKSTQSPTAAPCTTAQMDGFTNGYIAKAGQPAEITGTEIPGSAPIQNGAPASNPPDQIAGGQISTHSRLAGKQTNPLVLLTDSTEEGNKISADTMASAGQMWDRKCRHQHPVEPSQTVGQEHQFPGKRAATL